MPGQVREPFPGNCHIDANYPGPLRGSMLFMRDGGMQ